MSHITILDYEVLIIMPTPHHDKKSSCYFKQELKSSEELKSSTFENE